MTEPNRNNKDLPEAPLIADRSPLISKKAPFVVLLLLVSQTFYFFINVICGIQGVSKTVRMEEAVETAGTAKTSSFYYANRPNSPSQIVSDADSGVTTCDNDLVQVKDVILPESITHANRLIPKVVHVTSKTRCMTEAFAHNMERWKFPNHSFYFHDDAAVENLLNQDWPEFPHLKLVRNCILTGAGMADLWRYLLMYEYGGIYTDIDNTPGPNFKNGTDIQPHDDAYFVQEGGGFLSQYFMASSPRHPAMWMSVTATLLRLMKEPDIGKQYVPFVTGPGALMQGFEAYVWDGPADDYHKPGPGLYIGLQNRTVRVACSRRQGNSFVHRTAIGGGLKSNGLKSMGMTYYHRQKHTTDTSCLAKMHNQVYGLDYEPSSWGRRRRLSSLEEMERLWPLYVSANGLH